MASSFEATYKNPLHITEHAHNRYIERFGGATTPKSTAKRTTAIQKVVAFGMKVTPKDKIRVYLSNKCKDVEYILYRHIVAVVDKGRVVTVYKYDADFWQGVRCI